MRKIIISLLIIISMIANGFSQLPSWTEVDNAMKEMKPQTAEKLTLKILKNAKDQNNCEQIIKSYIYLTKIYDTYKEEPIQKSIDFLKKEKLSSPECQTFQNALLGYLHYIYYLRHRNQILDRTEKQLVQNEDISTWTIGNFAQTVKNYFDKALENITSLKKYSTQEYKDLFISGTAPMELRPTAFDLAAYWILEFYQNYEFSLTHPEDLFIINNPNYFLLAPNFINIQIPTTDTLSNQYNVLKIFQLIDKEHLNDQYTEALVDADLKRIEYVYSQYKGNDNQKDSLYIQALKQIIATYPQANRISMAYYKLALFYYENSDVQNPKTKDYLKKAVLYAQKAMEYPRNNITKEAIGLANYLISKIKEKELGLEVENPLLPNHNFLVKVKFRNTNKVHLRIYEINDDIYYSNKGYNKVLPQILKSKIINEQAISLSDPGDYYQHSSEIILKGLKPGKYAIVLSLTPEFKEDNNIMAFKKINSTSLNINLEQTGTKLLVFVTDRLTGKPLNNIPITIKYKNYRQPYKIKKQTSDKTGIVLADLSNNWENITIQATHQQSELTVKTSASADYYHEPPTNTRSVVFLDRKIYRPGQTLYFKGLIYTSDNKEQFLALTNKKISIQIKDANYQTLKSYELTTDNFGGFSGSFTIPQGKATGTWTLIIKDFTSTSFRVEEYRRPQFEVKFDPIKDAILSGQEVKLIGKAINYNGIPVENANVEYQVIKRVGWYWIWWWGEKPEETVMTSGSVKTDKDGLFTIKFPTDPYLEQGRLVEYIVKAKVTDLNGETHKAQTSVRVADQSVFVKIITQKNQFIEDSLKFSALIENINRVEQKQLLCQYQVYLLKPPTNHPLISRLWDKPDIQQYTKEQWQKLIPYYAFDNEANPLNWDTKKLIAQGKTYSGKKIAISPSNQGIYKIIIRTQDPITKREIEAKEIIYLIDSKKKQAIAPINFYATAKQEKYHPGQNAHIVLGSGWKNAHVFYQITWNNNILKQEVLFLQQEQKLIEFPITKEMTGGVAVNIILVHNNRAYYKQIKLSVPYSEKKLNIQITNFKDKVVPGQDINWKIKITDSKGNPVRASLLASAYDASLDAFVDNKWKFSIYRRYNKFYDFKLTAINSSSSAQVIDLLNKTVYFSPFTYPQFNWYGLSFYNNYYLSHNEYPLKSMRKLALSAEEENMPAQAKEINPQDQTVDIPIRKDFRETAFFYPDIITDSNGIAIISFKLPESLTKWQLQLFANTPQIDYALEQKEFKTVKPLMIYPNIPRFFRQGDTIWIAAKIYNNTTKSLSTKAQLILKNARTYDKLNIVYQQVQEIIIPANSAQNVRWQIIIPDNLTDPIEYTITALSSEYSDGQQDIVPVLNNRMLVTETLPLPVGPKEEKNFTLTKLANNRSSTLTNYRFVLEFNSNPVWYALTALPYTMEYPYECNEQLFSRMFANSVASYILNSDPKIKRVFDIWKMQNDQALTSELEKKQSLKQIILDETPWLLDGKNETENRARLSLLFNLNQMAYKQNKDIKKLLLRQNLDGGWGWFENMRSSWFITQHILLGFARLKDKNVLDYSKNKELKSALHSAVKYTDNQVFEYYQNLKKYNQNLDDNQLSPIIVHYLYMRSFYKNIPLSKTQIFDYFFGQLQKYWTSLNLYNQAVGALALYQWGDKETSKKIITSLRERSLENPEMGVYWAQNKPGWFWYQAPIETQAMIIEAFNNIEHDTAFVEKMKIWLLKNKQTNRWESTKATVEAVYALIFTGYNWLGENKPVKITVGNTTYPHPYQKTEAGTGYCQQIWTNKEITKDLANITVKNPNNHPAWGAVYWQYFENIDKITNAKTGINIERKYYKVEKTPQGESLIPITPDSPIKVGDEILVRIILTTDREIEFLHLKDTRPAGFEPVEQLSGYRWQGGIGYYQSIRDASANFFIDNLQKGKYVFEYRMFATLAGNFSAGIATFQSMYAPEFSAHSQGIRITIK